MNAKPLLVHEVAELVNPIVAFIEKWKDQEALDLHERVEYFTNNIGKLKAQSLFTRWRPLIIFTHLT